MVNWISLSTTTGNSGETQITLTVSPNTEYSSRTTTLNVTTQSKHLTDNIVINQAQKSATGSMTFNPSGLSYSYEGGILYLHFTANTDWNVVSWPTWVGVSGDVSGGTGSYVWGVTALQNSGLVDLNSQFTFYCGGNYFTIPVHQDAYQESSSISVAPSSISNISSGGSAYTITITSNTGWTVTSKPEWVTLSATAGTGNGTITATIASNSGNTRTGNIDFITTDNIDSASVSLTQNEVSASISTSPIMYVADSGVSTFNITVTSNTGWTVTDYPSWVVLSASAGTGNGTIQVTVQANDGVQRQEYIVFTTIDGSASSSVEVRQSEAHYHDYSQDYLTFEIISGGTIKYYSIGTHESEKVPLEYSKNNGAWTTITPTTGGTGIQVSAGDILRFREVEAQRFLFQLRGHFGGSNNCKYKVYGNIMSLLYKDTFSSATTVSVESFKYLFDGCTGMTDISNLVLPATVLARNCYAGMFRGCSNITGVSLDFLPATDLSGASYCYTSMFSGCTSLITAPELPATTLEGYCYNGMFIGCASLTQAPSILPATTLASDCYEKMFRNCTSLTTAPELPATTLVSYCYHSMFMGCSSLNYIKCLATDISAYVCTEEWVQRVQTSSGTFVKAAGMSSWTTGTDGIPNGWTVQDA